MGAYLLGWLVGSMGWIGWVVHRRRQCTLLDGVGAVVGADARGRLATTATTTAPTATGASDAVDGASVDSNNGIARAR